MLARIAIDTYLIEYVDIPLIDVRSPSEYQSGHIPGAVNIPLFSDEERARVGTTYKQDSREKAYDLGYAFVEPRKEYFIKTSSEVSDNGAVAVYCWRGGMRSRAFSEHIEANGLKEVYVIEGGYKAYRQHMMESFTGQGEIRVLGGYTGSGKTLILKALQQKGEQVIDLEGIAHHKGSAFGAIGQSPQPPNEHFANLLFREWNMMDHSRPVWVEDESIHIGSVFLPEVFFRRMRETTLYFLNIPKEQRARFLVEDYGEGEREELARSISKISKRLGGMKTKLALEALQEGDYYTAALITLDYYDKFYLKGLKRRDESRVVMIESGTTDIARNVMLIMKTIGSL